MSAFEELGLHSNLCEMLEKNGIDLPTAIQQESIPLILGGGDLCACAETGTGKTMSFIVSSLQIVHELFRNIGAYSKSDNNNNKEMLLCDNNIKENKIKQFVIKSLNNYNPRVQINNDKYECICRNSSNFYEEIKVDCEIKNDMYAFEIKILDKSFINVGFCPLIKDTLKYNYTYSSNGCKYTNSREEKYGEPFLTNDIITCLINKRSNIIAFKKNGKFMGNAFKIFYKYNDIPFFPYIFGTSFHVSFQFKNLKYIDNTYYKELAAIFSDNTKNENSERKIYFDSDIKDVENSSTFGKKETNNCIGDNHNESVENNQKKLYCIVLCPTRDLAMQTYNNYLRYSECFDNCSINIELIVGGEQNFGDKRKKGSKNPNSYSNIVVCTSFKLIENIKKNTINLNNIKLLILDEADELINSDEKSILQIKDACMKYSQNVQTCFFSATLQEKNVRECINKITNKPIFIDLKYGKNIIPSHIYVCIYYVKSKETYQYSDKEIEYANIIYNEKMNNMNYSDLYEYTDKVHVLNKNIIKKEDISLNIKINKLKKLVHIINVFNMQNGIIFCRTNLDCDNIYNFLNHVGDGKAYKGSVATTKENKYSCVILKGKMSNDERKNNLNAFKKGEVRFLICTDVAARGIDIQNLRYLIIMTMSDNYSAFFHKVGRVGRDGKNSLCIVLSSENEEEKVWYHNCPSRGVNCYNRNLKEEKGCTIYINESYYIKTINEMLEIPMHVIDSKYYYVENLFDPLNYLKNNLVNNNNNKSRRDQNKNQNSIFADIIHSDFSNMFDQNINNIKKLKATICCKHYELMNFAI
ncbi:DEAD/DEAH box ATP-dependent RNA helicase, putative [Plasmodium berghei]|uniref:ATP-dependent RNA helicase n=2 Tax=Plasmodium berghei TaxID=5821 RepID=A0A509AP69_PLABA|nr:ATP-dependent RNA helicase DDX1, putative [Plasmodium berghei ANKA]CXI81987.1 DEAD/DEAH box ATP-dependent RNA helicase, putative [Plasmodium berghei]SCM25570.1 DEAD/DEAH box ATP-dependent RNA helicase, putative [Plasmodium berghei]SCN27407.1 DEAD/DEAH box ATP-dependent RNA helicase, putative [Plasmodium berghei]SCO62084.1 DEAD/DEAH box ATP-dependent RNA helicase, putative [Plasmodium berghei]SCO63834.1 DEAD/DEAH box ATP-dependent RNA helicase, putative [Plasmodium berghei]|eukprot:XP_034423040.1 ATP-dependent RNA helicase DDX1, putative [Plasmodium berghei ANKA]